jgi:hypothetical protein
MQAADIVLVHAAWPGQLQAAARVEIIQGWRVASVCPDQFVNLRIIANRQFSILNQSAIDNLRILQSRRAPPLVEHMTTHGAQNSRESLRF